MAVEASLPPMSVGTGDVYILDVSAAPIGEPVGALAKISLFAAESDLAAHVIESVVDRAGVPADEIEDVYFGSSNQAGEDNRDVARIAGLLAGLPVTVPGAIVPPCASGLEAVGDAARALALGEGDLIWRADGVDDAGSVCVRREPAQAYSREPAKVYDTTIGWRFVNPNFPHSNRGYGRNRRTSPSCTTSAARIRTSLLRPRTSARPPPGMQESLTKRSSRSRPRP